MPSGLGGSYRSLADDVYKSTTVAENGNYSMLESVKKAFSFANPANKNSEPLIPRNENIRSQPTIMSARDRKMPTSTSAEETALLGRQLVDLDPRIRTIEKAGTASDGDQATAHTMPSDSMDDIELKNIQLQFPTAKTLARGDSSALEERIETGKSSVLVAVQGNRNKPAILTYHDIGLNYVSSFQAFFNYIDMRALLENFCVYHVNAPGQEEGATTLPEDFEYPTMDELADQLNFVLSHYALRSVIGFGVGAGANILARFALSNPEKVEGLCLINCISTRPGWIEWGYQKMNSRYLRSKGMTQGVLDYLMWHHFGRGTEERNHDLAQVYKSYFERHVNPVNLAMFIDSYIQRSDLNITRDSDPSRSQTLKMPVMNITGALSPHVDDTVTLNGRLDPTCSTWMKIQDCGMVLEEQPGKVSEAFRLFLQGQGYALKVNRKVSAATLTGSKVAPLTDNKMAMFRQTSVDGIDRINKARSPPAHWSTSAINITENPISEAIVC